MKNIKNNTSINLITGLFLFLSNILNAQIPDRIVRDFINKYKEPAIEQMVLFKIPASVIMAQAIKESGCGTSYLAKKANNHFGIKCHKEWGGDYFKIDDDSLNEPFRKYKSVQDSFLDHSMFLVSRPRYDFLFQYKITDYFKWCLGLKQAGYATAKNYAHELLYIIEVYNLAELDNIIPLHNSLNYEQLLACSEKNIIESKENYFATAEKHILAQVIFNLNTKEEEPLLVRSNSPSTNAD